MQQFPQINNYFFLNFSALAKITTYSNNHEEILQKLKVKTNLGDTHTHKKKSNLENTGFFYN